MQTESCDPKKKKKKSERKEEASETENAMEVKPSNPLIEESNKDKEARNRERCWVKPPSPNETQEKLESVLYTYDRVLWRPNEKEKKNVRVKKIQCPRNIMRAKKKKKAGGSSVSTDPNLAQGPNLRTEMAARKRFNGVEKKNSHKQIEKKKSKV